MDGLTMVARILRHVRLLRFFVATPIGMGVYRHSSSGRGPRLSVLARIYQGHLPLEIHYKK